MTPAFASAGKAILNSVYQICAEHGVPRSEIADLLQQLTFAVAEGQADAQPHDKLRWKREPGAPLSPELIAEIRRLHSEGLSDYRIVRELHVCRESVRKYSIP